MITFHKFPQPLCVRGCWHQLRVHTASTQKTGSTSRHRYELSITSDTKVIISAPRSVIQLFFNVECFYSPGNMLYNLKTSSRANGNSFLIGEKERQAWRQKYAFCRVNESRQTSDACALAAYIVSIIAIAISIA